ncbi:MAG: hypothetical protein ACRBG0_09580 [Lewinella sp.]|uniref:hypothetical protein n=1 Tax=Lewinella sp. TaxID=2004506 RepID=UPI003D6B82D0
MLQVPIYLTVFFVLITFTTTALFWWVLKVSKNAEHQPKWSRLFLGGSFLWLGLQAFLSFQGTYYEHLNALPPCIAILGLIPPLMLIVTLFLRPSGKRFIDSLPLPSLTMLHVIRIPVELVLYGLFLAGTIPELMTFTGRNFDILAGLTAPLIVYIGWRPAFRRNLLIGWNVVSLALLLSIVIHALLAAPFPLQQLAFDQPNIAVLYFPFSWLPTYVVPVVLFCHLAALRKLY